jgi:hypothetical protein
MRLLGRLGTISSNHHNGISVFITELDTGEGHFSDGSGLLTAAFGRAVKGVVVS